MVPKICITGGPGGGKTTGLASIVEFLQDLGFYTIVAEEAFTYLKVHGLLPADASKSQPLIIKTTLELEEKAHREAEHAKAKGLKPIIVCDRGIPDGRGYSSQEEYVAALIENGIESYIEARDGRYPTGVFHMLTAAKGAEEFYTTANNVARHETPEQARLQDDRTMHAWIGTPHLRIVDNSTDFHGKLQRLKQEICRALGIPMPVEIERKFLCKKTSRPLFFPSGTQHIEIEQAYLLQSDPAIVPRIRKRGQSGLFMYFRTDKRFISPGKNEETERLISVQEYETSMALRDPCKNILRKTRTCFVYRHQYFEFDRIPLRDGSLLSLLELELSEENQEIRFPPFIPVFKEVTDDPEYTNVKIAERV